MSKEYTGINIQFPISQDILSGEKIVETRTYPIPEQYLNEPMLMIETPGKKGKFKSRGVALIKFTECYKYKSKKEFYNDIDKHLVHKDSDWAWKDKPKYGWYVEVIRILNPPLNLDNIKKGIVYTKNLTI
jgi:hypothetical protein